MEIRMYECGFGDCFRLRETNQTDLYVDFGIHSSSWQKIDKTKRFDNIIAGMGENKDFLLSHYHEDHYNGAVYMAAKTKNRFNEVYISDVWNMSGSVSVTVLTLLRGIFTRSVMYGNNTIIDFLQSVCNGHSRIHFISRGMRFHNNQYIALWPEKNYVANKAERLLNQIEKDLEDNFLKEIEEIAVKLNRLVVSYEESNGRDVDSYEARFVELQDEYRVVQEEFNRLYGDNYKNNTQYKLTKFGNKISIVFQNYQGDRNVLFTGDFGKKRNWSIIEKNKDNVVEMHSCYEVIKIPHHGTDAYYHCFASKINDKSTLIIPNGYIRQPWIISYKYGTDSMKMNNKTVCADHASCNSAVCPNCTCIYPAFYLDI